MSEEANLAAVVAKLNAGGAVAYGIGDIPSPLPSFYVEVHVMERRGEGFRADGNTSVDFYRVLLRAVAKKYVNAQRQRALAAAALDGAYLTVGSAVSTQISRAVSDDPIGPDDEWHSGTSEFSYAL